MKTTGLISVVLLLAGGCAPAIEDESSTAVAATRAEIATMVDTLPEEFAATSKGEVLDRSCIPPAVMAAKAAGPMRLDDGMLPYGGIQPFIAPGVRLPLECRRAAFTRVVLLAAREPVRVRELATTPRIDNADWCYDANRRAIHFRSETLHSDGAPLGPEHSLAVVYVAAPYEEGDPYDCPTQ